MRKKSGKKTKNVESSSWTKFLGDDLKKMFIFVTAAVIVCIGLMVLAMFSPSSGGGGTFRPHGRIVITSDSKSPDGTVSATFERCRYFIIYDLAKKRFSAVANPFFNEGNPGVQEANFIANKNEEAIITGNISSAAFHTLENYNIQIYLVPKMSVRNAVRRFLDGRLVHINTPNQMGLVNAPGGFFQQPAQTLEMQRAAWNAPLPQTPVASHRMAYCPRCGLQMPLGSHIRTNRIMCPYCPGQNMQIMMSDGPTIGQAQPVGFGGSRGGSTGGMVTRGVVVLK